MIRRLVFALCLSVMAMPAAPYAGTGDTWVDPDLLSRSKPGALFRVWPLDGGVRPGVKGYRILYRSTGHNGQPVAVTGALIFPADGGGSAKRNVVAWAHPTTGVVSKCAPTLLPDLSGTIEGIDALNDLGYVVVAPDYVGLGTADHHPYLIGTAAGWVTLDAVRAAQQLKDARAGERFAVWGHSQGGHAALYAGSEAQSYAPELHLVGVAAAAPATNLVKLFDADRNTSSGRSLTAMTVLSWSRVFGVPLLNLVQAASERQFESLAGDCIESIEDFFKESDDEKALARNFLRVDPVKDPFLHAIMEDNSPGALPGGTKVFLAQSSADTLVLPKITMDYMHLLCAGGAHVTYHAMQGSSHMVSGRDSASAAVSWMRELFDGRTPPNNCRAN